MHHFRDGQAPDITAYPDDPLCVEYKKRDITADNGGAARFLAAEPSRFAIACQVPLLAAGPLAGPGRPFGPASRAAGTAATGSTRAAAGPAPSCAISGSTVSMRVPSRPNSCIATASPTLAAIMRSYGASANFGVRLDPQCRRELVAARRDTRAHGREPHMLGTCGLRSAGARSTAVDAVDRSRGRHLAARWRAGECRRPNRSPVVPSLPPLDPPAQDVTLEACSDTMIPGREALPGDPAIAGAARGPGAVQAGAVDFMEFGPTGRSSHRHCRRSSRRSAPKP